MNHEIAQRPDQHTGNSTPYSLRRSRKLVLLKVFFDPES